MLSVEEVFGRISQMVRPVAPRNVPLADALGKVLGEPVAMAEDSPAFDRAIVDGYAVRAADVAIGAKLELVGHIDAGSRGFATPLETGQCVGINTGAMMPVTGSAGLEVGADAVLMVEHTQGVTENGKAYVVANRPVAAGYGIQKKGADATAGEIVLAPGRRLSPADIAVCAAAGAGQVLVRCCRAALLVTGDELVDAAASLQPGQIRNSNHPMLAGLLRSCAGVSPDDGTFLDLGTARDAPEILRALLLRGVEACDLLVVSGGMSMGTKDYVPAILKELGFIFHVEKVRMKPGKPFILGVRQADGRTTYAAGLPGNPVSAFVTFQLFVRAMVARLTGHAEFSWEFEARTAAELEPNGDREFFVPCRLQQNGPEWLAEPLKWKGSADLFTLARAQGLIVRQVSAAAAPVGEVVRVVRIS